MSDRQSKLNQELRPIVESLGYEFWALELVQSRGHSLLRIYIELEDRHINVDDCARVSRALSERLDSIDLISEDYHLEVSSPGLDRPLFTASHFARALGEEVNVQTHLPIDGRKRYRARIQSVEDDVITLSFEKKTLTIRVDNIAKAQVIPDFSKPRVARINDPKPDEQGDAPSEGGDFDPEAQ